MRRAQTLAVLLGAYAGVSGQNLVPNPGFEMVSVCPDGISQIENAVGWDAVRGTPDLLNACATNWLVDVPHNVFGEQLAANGSGYAQVISFNQPGCSINCVREWIGCSLLEPLTVGVTYFVSAKISWTTSIDSLWFKVRYANDHIGFLLRNDAWQSSDLQIPFNEAHYWSSELVTDSSNWTLIGGSFIADSAYGYLAFGNFFDDQNSSYVLMDPDAPAEQSYYYVDDVCLSPDPDYCSIWSGLVNLEAPTVELFPNPFREELQIRCSVPHPPREVRLVDAVGRELWRGELTSGAGEMRLDATSLPAGFLALIVSDPTGVSRYYPLVHVSP